MGLTPARLRDSSDSTRGAAERLRDSSDSFWRSAENPLEAGSGLAWSSRSFDDLQFQPHFF